MPPRARQRRCRNWTRHGTPRPAPQIRSAGGGWWHVDERGLLAADLEAAVPSPSTALTETPPGHHRAEAAFRPLEAGASRSHSRGRGREGVGPEAVEPADQGPWPQRRIVVERVRSPDSDWMRASSSIWSDAVVGSDRGLVQPGRTPVATQPPLGRIKPTSVSKSGSPRSTRSPCSRSTTGTFPSRHTVIARLPARPRRDLFTVEGDALPFPVREHRQVERPEVGHRRAAAAGAAIVGGPLLLPHARC